MYTCDICGIMTSWLLVRMPNDIRTYCSKHAKLRSPLLEIIDILSEPIDNSINLPEGYLLSDDGEVIIL